MTGSPQHRVHVAAPLSVDLPRHLEALHRATTPGDVVTIVVHHGAGASARVEDAAVGAGFEVTSERVDADDVHVRAIRLRTLPDVVAPGMRLLVVGLNPSLYAADAGVGFARPGNRFWPAMLAAGLTEVDRDPDHLLRLHHIGMTDLVKRATPRADEVTPHEYADGLARLQRLCEWLRPAAVCVVGLTGWRAATGERRAQAGWQERRLGASAVYLMPNPSGLNAHTTVDGLAAHLLAAAARRPDQIS